MSEQNVATAAESPVSAGDIDWSSSSNDEDRAGFTPAERAKVAEPPQPPPHEPDDAPVEGDDTLKADNPDKLAIDEDDDAPEIDAEEGDEPPEFWSKEKKALWSKITDPEVKAAILEHERTASTVTSKRLEEASLKVKAATEAEKAALDNQAQAVQWWQTMAPVLNQVVEGRWAGVDWNRMAQESPAEYVKFKAQYEQERGVLQQMGQKHQADMQVLQQRAQAAEQEARRVEHSKLAEKYPREFGDTKAAEQTYGVLSNWLVSQGIPSERISTIYEAPIVEIVRKAYKYDQLRQKAKEVTNPKPDAASASTTPKRVVPGPARSAGNPTDEAHRQALGRLRSGQRISEEDGRLLFR
jgi:hypothetical protein